MPRSFSRGSAPSPARLAPFGASFSSVIFYVPSVALPRFVRTAISSSRGWRPAAMAGRQPRSDDYFDYLIPAVAQALAPAIAQMAEAVSNLSATTVDSMLAAVTHSGVIRDAGSVMLESAGSTVVPFSSDAGGVWPASRMRAMDAASWASL